jgi:hypothetical protein
MKWNQMFILRGRKRKTMTLTPLSQPCDDDEVKTQPLPGLMSLCMYPLSWMALTLLRICLDKKQAAARGTRFAWEAALALFRTLDMSSPPVWGGSGDMI